MCDYMAFDAGRLQNLGLSMMETMQKSAAPMSLMLNDELTPEPQGGLEHIFFSTIMFHEVWVVAIFFFFSADVAGSATPRFLIDTVEVMEKERGTEVVTVLPDTVAKSLQDKYCRPTLNGYRTSTLTYLVGPLLQ